MESLFKKGISITVVKYEIRKHFRISQNSLLLLSSRNLNISQSKLYIWNLQFMRFKMIYDMFMFYEL